MISNPYSKNLDIGMLVHKQFIYGNMQYNWYSYVTGSDVVNFQQIV